MMDWNFTDCKSMAVRASNELPPEAFFHVAEFVRQGLRYGFSNQDVRATRIMDRCGEGRLVEKIEKPRKNPTN